MKKMVLSFLPLPAYKMAPVPTSAAPVLGHFLGPWSVRPSVRDAVFFSNLQTPIFDRRFDVTATYATTAALCVNFIPFQTIHLKGQ